jgi:hypothetical protein
MWSRPRAAETLQNELVGATPSLIEHVQEHQRFLKAAGIVALATGLFATWVKWGIGGDTSVRYFDDLATVLAVLAATVLCLRAGARHAGELRLFWWLLAGACGAWTLAEMTWALYELVLHESVPVPSWADVGYLAGIPLAVVALVCHPATRGGGTQKARSVLDGLMVATALLFLSWTIVLGPLWRNTDLSNLGGVVALAYPFGDVIIIFFIVLAIRGIAAGDRLALWCLLGGLLATALADSTYSYLTGVKGYESGNLIDTGWFAGYLGIALGAFCSETRDRVVNRSGLLLPTPTSLIAPFLPVLGALSVAAVEIQLGHRLDDVAWISAFALVALVLARQGLLVFDLVAHSEEREAVVAKQLAHAALGHAIPEMSGSSVPAMAAETPGNERL